MRAARLGRCCGRCARRWRCRRVRYGRPGRIGTSLLLLRLRRSCFRRRRSACSHCLRRRGLAVGVGGARASRPSVVLQRVLDLPADRALGDDVVSHGYLPQVAAALKSGEAGEASCVVHHGWSDGAPKLRADQVAQADHAESLSAQISGQLAAGASSRANIQRWIYPSVKSPNGSLPRKKTDQTFECEYTYARSVDWSVGATDC